MLRKIVGAAGVALAFGGILGLAGCGGSSGSSSGSGSTTAAPPAATLTAIASCVVDGQNDVVIGGSDANPGCGGTVEMEPVSGNPPVYHEIRVEQGGVLRLAGAYDGDSTQSATRAAISPELLEPEVDIICIQDGGKIYAGSEKEPISNADPLEVEFVGSRQDKDTDPNSPCKGFSKGIDVTKGGSLLLYGGEGVPERGEVSWTTLSRPAGPMTAGAAASTTGPMTLDLTADVATGKNPWKKGDWIAVATTTYTPFETEFVQIEEVTSHDTPGCATDSTEGCSTVTLMQPLKYYHFGSLPPSPADATGCENAQGRAEAGFLCDGKDRNYGVDERAEVGLISRDIEFTAQTEPVTVVPPPATSSVHWGGEIKIHQGFHKVVIQGVRLSKFGKDQLGSYPIHFHLVGDIAESPNPGTANAVIDADSVDHSYNKCVTIHETDNITIENLVCARIVGQIFYEELGSQGDRYFGDDSGIVFKDDLGLGAMSNSFDINGPLTGKDGEEWDRQKLIDTYWWAGDYMTNAQCGDNCIGYDGFNIPDTDNQAQYVNGSCTKFQADTGSYAGYVDPGSLGEDFKPCSQRPADPVYIEPANGFWIQNPGTDLIGDAIAGCQGVGRGVWWLSPGKQINVNGTMEWLKFDRFGTFENDRVSACYAGLYDEAEESVHGEQLFPRKDGNDQSDPVVATLEGATITRNRYRGVWLRPSWFVLDHAHLASNLLDVTLVTSGGLDGNYPGVWELLENSVVVGLSTNNVERWGPCPEIDELGKHTGGQNGCVDHTPGGTNPHSAAVMANGYPTPYRNAFGYMIYDGPVRLEHDRFVNFNYDPGWTQAAAKSGDLPCGGKGFAFYAELDRRDCKFLQAYERTHRGPALRDPVPKPWEPSPYEGDAALGWFDSNQSAYPTGTVSKDLMWTNTNLRHQIFTRYVTLNTNFNDGDKNTAIIDEDGTLDGLAVRPAADLGTSPNPVHPISLNNLPLNDTSNAVEECHSRGGQNQTFEERDSSLMSPTTMGTLEFMDLYPFLVDSGGKAGTWTCDDRAQCLQTYPGNYPQDNDTHWQDVTFTRDDEVPRAPPPSTAMYRPSMTLYSRNGQGVWEPKLANGYGYTVSFHPSTSPTILHKPQDPNAIDRFKELRLRKPAGAWPFMDVGFTDVVDPNISPRHPFFVRIGICYSDKDGNPPKAPPQGEQMFTIKRGYRSWGNNASNVYKADKILLENWTEYLDCHDLDTQDHRYINVPNRLDGYTSGCPAGGAKLETTLTPASGVAGLGTNTEPVLDKYYYNSKTGMLYFNVEQVLPNAGGASPSGSCANGSDNDSSCPPAGESFYACPKVGCPLYTIQMNKSVAKSYSPGASECVANPKNLMPAPPASARNALVLADDTSTVIDRRLRLDREDEPYHEALNGPECPATTHPPQ